MFAGYTRCGRCCVGTIKSDGKNEITISWTLTPRCQPKVCKNHCKKNYVRQITRTKLAKDLVHEHVDVFRSKEAHILMDDNEPEPPNLPSANVLHVLKTEQKKKTFLDTDPIRAIMKMKAGEHSNAIHSVWADPFCTHYWTNTQITLAKKCFEQDITVSIDATGSVCNKFEGKHLFLYEIVVHCIKQFSVAQMLSCCHRTDDIQYFLQMWHRAGAPCPREIVCDGCMALLNAIAKVETQHIDIGKKKSYYCIPFSIKILL